MLGQRRGGKAKHLRSLHVVERHIVFPFWGFWTIDFKRKSLNAAQQTYLLWLKGFPFQAPARFWDYALTPLFDCPQRRRSHPKW